MYILFIFLFCARNVPAAQFDGIVFDRLAGSPCVHDVTEPLLVFVSLNLWPCQFTHHRKSIKIYSIKIIDFMKKWKHENKLNKKWIEPKQNKKEKKSNQVSALVIAHMSTYILHATHCTNRVWCVLHRVYYTVQCLYKYVNEYRRSWYVNIWIEWMK